MIASAKELDATLEYASKLADALEGLRLYAQESGEATLLPLNAAGPLAQLRESLTEARVYAERLAEQERLNFAPTSPLLPRDAKFA